MEQECNEDGFVQFKVRDGYDQNKDGRVWDRALCYIWGAINRPYFMISYGELKKERIHQ